MVVTYDENGVQKTIEEVRYPIGGDIVIITPNMDNATINDTIKGEGKIVYFTAGTYTGDIQITDNNVLLFGDYDEENSEFTTVIEGNIKVMSKGVRIRGLLTNGDISLTGSDFSASYCEFVNGTMPGNGVKLIHNEFTGTASVTGNNVILLDNIGL